MTVYGLTSDALPDDWTPLEAATVVKCLDEDGEMSLAIRSTDGLTSWERVGMLQAAVDANRDDIRDCSEASE